MISNLKRFLKSTALTIAKRRGGFSSTGLSKSIFNQMRIRFGPPQKVAEYPNGAEAACVISIDFDHLTKSQQSTRDKWLPIRSDDLLARNRAGTQNLIRVSEKYEIPMTWAICGKTAEEDPSSYEGILRSNQPQEIGLHTYSHADVSACSASELELEVQRCLEVLKLSSPPKTFIFPWNREGHFDKLKQMGFQAYRDKTRAVAYPDMARGLWNIPPTYYIDQKSYGAHKLIKKYLDACMSWSSVFHLWLHPWSIVLDGGDSCKFTDATLDPLFSYLKERKESGKLTICTMGELASFCGESSENQALRGRPKC